MKLKESIQIAAYTYTVDFVEKVDDKHNLGESDPETLKIIIKRGMSKEQTVSTFLHECIESANDVYGIGLKHNQIAALESFLYQFIPQIEN